MNNDTKRPEVTETHRALARSIDIWVRQDGVHPDFIANQLAQLTADKDKEIERLDLCCTELHGIIDNHGYPSGVDYDKAIARAEAAELLVAMFRDAVQPFTEVVFVLPNDGELRAGCRKIKAALALTPASMVSKRLVDVGPLGYIEIPADHPARAELVELRSKLAELERLQELPQVLAPEDPVFAKRYADMMGVIGRLRVRLACESGNEESAVIALRARLSEQDAELQRLREARGCLDEVAHEVGNQTDNYAAIIRAVKARDGAYHRAKQLEAQRDALIAAGDALLCMGDGYRRGKNQHPNITAWDAAKQGAQPVETMDKLTLDKIASIKARGYVQTGAVLLSESGKETCIVDRSAVRWLSQEELRTAMNPPCTVEAQELTYASELAALREDRARLDFLDHHRGIRITSHQFVRAAIDAARKSGGAK